MSLGLVGHLFRGVSQFALELNSIARSAGMIWNNRRACLQGSGFWLPCWKHCKEHRPYNSQIHRAVGQTGDPAEGSWEEWEDVAGWYWDEKSGSVLCVPPMQQRAQGKDGRRRAHRTSKRESHEGEKHTHEGTSHAGSIGHHRKITAEGNARRLLG